MLLLGALAAPAQAATPPAEARLERALKSWVEGRVGRDATGPVRYSSALVDLNGDRAPEALVYLSGRDWCGSGGCNLYILNRERGAWRLVNSVTITNPPIRLLTTKGRGWSDIGVYVRGGGIIRGYEAVLRFNGRRYPGNPTVAPAYRGRNGAPGRVLIGSDSRERRPFP